MWLRSVPSWWIALVGVCVASLAAGAADLEFTTISHGSSEIQSARFVAIRDKASWSKLWAEHSPRLQPAQPVPAIDFRNRMIVAVFLGMRPNGCYSVEISRVTSERQAIVVEYRVREPRPAEPCTAALVFPAHIVATASSSAPVSFVVARGKKSASESRPQTATSGICS